MHICKAGDFPVTGSVETSEMSKFCNPASSVEASANDSGVSIRMPEKKTKVPRPPNAFILYRAKHHPTLKSEQPTLKNNDISVILGRRWKNETENVKNEFRAMAAKLKKQHADENPGYQYAPRKPSEKKRRMTARKLAKLHAGRIPARTRSVSDFGISDDQISLAPEPDNPNASEAVSAADMLSIERYTYPTTLRHHQCDDMSLIFPAGYSEIERDYASKMSPMFKPHPIDLNDNSSGHLESSSHQQAVNGIDFWSTLVDWDGLAAGANTNPPPGANDTNNITSTTHATAYTIPQAPENMTAEERVNYSNLLGIYAEMLYQQLYEHQLRSRPTLTPEEAGRLNRRLIPADDTEGLHLYNEWRAAMTARFHACCPDLTEWLSQNHTEINAIVSREEQDDFNVRLQKILWATK